MSLCEHLHVFHGTASLEVIKFIKSILKAKSSLCMLIMNLRYFILYSIYVSRTVKIDLVHSVIL